MKNLISSIKTHPLISSAMEKEDTAPKKTIEESECAIETRVLLIGGQSTRGEAAKHQGHDDKVGSLHDLC